jgi:hypothetical protein
MGLFLSSVDGIECNALVVVHAQPRTLNGTAREGQRLMFVDTRWQRTDGFEIFWFKNGRGETITMTAKEAGRCLGVLSGPRRA